MEFTDVSKTAIVTLRSHVIESEKSKPLITDPMARYCLDRLMDLAPASGQDQIFTRKMSEKLTLHIALRARKYDQLTNAFISQNPGCTVVNLGCGFDTRYWRINSRDCTYIELDLPEVAGIKRKALGEKLCYDLIGCSVLDTSWIDRVTSSGNRNFLLIAEGLFMYLDKRDVIVLFRTFSERFDQSKILLEVVTEKYTRGLWKKMVVMKMKNELGLDSGSSYNFGIKRAGELEAFGKGIQVVEEWSYFEDPDMRPRWYKYLGLSRTQWTIAATING